MEGGNFLMEGSDLAVVVCMDIVAFLGFGFLGVLGGDLVGFDEGFAFLSLGCG
jgi:hypothetical protein